MNITNPLYTLIVFLIAYFTIYIVKKTEKEDKKDLISRYEGIDSLRGFLAIFVYIYHSIIWYDYLKTGHWKVPDSNFCSQLGSTTVAIFFMITSFLFVTKLLNTKDEFNFSHFFVSRIYRLVPVYYFSIFLIVVIVFALSNWKFKEGWEFNEGIIDFFKSLLLWMSFNIIGGRLFNGLILTPKINAGVVWSLAFEWLFYFSLPLISFVISKKKPNKIYLIISLIFIICFWFLYKDETFWPYMLSFLGGAIAPFILKYSSMKINVNSFIYSIITMLCFLSIPLYHSSHEIGCKIAVIIAFNLVAMGNTMFGVFKNSNLKLLGEISYSTYLLHGILIFITFYFIIGIEKTKLLSSLEYSILIYSITPFLVLISYLSFKFIEEPFMKKSKMKLSKTNLND